MFRGPHHKRPKRQTALLDLYSLRRGQLVDAAHRTAPRQPPNPPQTTSRRRHIYITTSHSFLRPSGNHPASPTTQLLLATRGRPFQSCLVVIPFAQLLNMEDHTFLAAEPSRLDDNLPVHNTLPHHIRETRSPSIAVTSTHHNMFTPVSVRS